MRRGAPLCVLGLEGLLKGSSDFFWAAALVVCYRRTGEDERRGGESGERRREMSVRGEDCHCQ